MNQGKLSCDEVPVKFQEWLLSMGCPQETVPPIDKISEMCRGEYYMVWRSLMEHVGPKDSIKNKRLQVFIDDVMKSQQQKNNPNTIKPEELSLWLEHRDLKQKVIEAEARIAEKTDKIQQINNKFNKKMAQYKLSTKKLQDGQRRVFMLQQLAEELKEKKAKLIETKTIAESMSCVNDDQNVEGKLGRCIEVLSRQTSRATVAGTASLVANPVACSSTASTNSDYNDAVVEQTSSLAKCRGEAVFKQLYERRAGLCASVAVPRQNNDERKSPQSVLTETAGLHCKLALETMKNKALIKQSKNKLIDAVAEHTNGLPEEACELLVIQCERAGAEASINCLKNLTEDINKRQGIFTMDPFTNEDGNLEKQIQVIDKSIISKKDELKKLMATADGIERKTQNVRECLLNLFNSFHEESPKNNHSEGPSTSLPQESLLNIRQFYEEKREEVKSKMELSMDLDTSDSCSFGDNIEGGNLKFSDELKYYLKHFNLEKNRKLVLDSGEKIWIFDTVQSSLYNLFAKLLNQDRNIPLSPIQDLTQNLSRLSWEVEFKNQLEMLVKDFDGLKSRNFSIDITSKIEEEEKLADKIKKKLNENINNLVKTEKTLDIGMENIKFWSENKIKKYISSNRNFEGKPYKEIEACYVESLL